MPSSSWVFCSTRRSRPPCRSPTSRQRAPSCSRSLPRRCLSPPWSWSKRRCSRRPELGFHSRSFALEEQFVAKAQHGELPGLVAEEPHKELQRPGAERRKE
eukprot:15444812-Alexandrium_andersonii.AAC.1